ncbi:MAG: hypothetical protein ACRC4L_00555 [Mycoplasma sp.]
MFKERLEFKTDQDGLVFEKLNMDSYNDIISKTKFLIKSNYKPESFSKEKIIPIDYLDSKLKMHNHGFAQNDIGIEIKQTENIRYTKKINLEEVKRSYMDSSFNKELNGIKSRNNCLTNYKEWPRITGIKTNAILSEKK